MGQEVVEMIRGLTELDQTSAAAFGAKAANLGVMIAHGLEVPPGFALSHDLYHEYVEENAIDITPQQHLSHSEELIAALTVGTMPSAVAGEITRRCAELAAGGDAAATRFAIRSSATCEDGRRVSMAGVFQSYVDLRSDEVIDAVKRCYTSLFSDRALDAYEEYGTDLGSLAMAVIVQRFVRGAPSGVLFTADPVRGRSDCMQLSVVNGPCEEAVTGSGPKARITVDAETGDVADAHVPAGVVRPSNELLHHLVDQARGLETRFGCPLDIEWTSVDGRPVLLQARPLTGITKTEFAVHWDRDEDAGYHWQWPAGPVRPLIADLHTLETQAGSEGAAQSGLSFFYTDVTEQNGYLYFRQMDLPDADARRAEHRARIAALKEQGKNIFTDVYLPKIRELQEANRWILELTPHAPVAELLRGLESGIAYLRTVMSYHWLVVNGAVFEDTLATFRDQYGLSSSDTADLLFTPTVLGRKRAALVRMAALVRAEPELSALFEHHPSDRVVYARLPRSEPGRRLLAMLEELNATFGSITVEEHLDYRNHAEAPETVISGIRSVLDVDQRRYAATREELLRHQAELETRLLATLPEGEAPGVRAELEYWRKAYAVRDDHAYYIDFGASGYLRHVIVQIGRALVEHGVLRGYHDVELLRLDELRAAVTEPSATLTALVAERRARLLEQRSLAAPEWIGAPPADSADAAAPPTEAAAGVTAATAAPGAVIARGYSGLAMRVRGPVVTAAGLRNSPPERFILVLSDVRELDPSRYTSRIAGVVVEEGSPFDHIGIWAREHAVPTLFSADGVTRMVRDGDEVELDGVEELLRRV